MADKLPDEVLEAILETLCTPDGHKVALTKLHRVRLYTLANLCRVSRRFSRLSRPLLFRYLDLSLLGFGCLVPILRHLHRHADLRHAVKEMSLPWDGQKHPTPSRNTQSTDAESQELYDQILGQLSLPVDVVQRFNDSLQLNHHEAGIALLVCMSANLERLIMYDVNLETSLITAVCKAAVAEASSDSLITGATLKPLQKLRTLEYRDNGQGRRPNPIAGHNDHWQGKGDSTEMEELSPFLKLPMLQTLLLDRIICSGPIETLSGSRTIRKIHLRNSFVNWTGLRDLCVKFPNLVDLWIDSGVDFDRYKNMNPSQQTEDLQFAEVGDTLSRYATNLTALHLSYRWEGRSTHESHPTPLRTLDSLSSLTHLTLPLDALIIESASLEPNYLSQRLPQSLQSLNILKSSCSNPSTLSSQMYYVMMFLKHLRRIHVALSHGLKQKLIPGNLIRGTLWRESIVHDSADDDTVYHTFTRKNKWAPPSEAEGILMDREWLNASETDSDPNSAIVRRPAEDSLSETQCAGKAGSMASLPDEILDAIFRQLAISGNTPDCPEIEEDHMRLRALGSLNRTCRRFRRIARGALFQCLDFEVIGMLHLKPILWSLLGRDHLLCRSVQKIRLPEFDVPERDDLNSGNGCLQDARLLGVYAKTLKRLAIPEHLRVRLHDGLSAGFADAEASLLLAICPDLRQLTITVPYKFEESLVAAMATVAADEVDTSSTSPYLIFTPLRQIVRLKADHWDTEYGMHMSKLYPFLNLPALHSISLHRALCHREKFDVQKVSSPIRSIEFTDSDVHTNGVRSLLQGFPNLVDLSIGLGQGFLDEPDLLFRDVGEVLSEYGTSLTDFTLDMGQPCSGFDAQLPMRTLATMTSLVSLTVPLDALFKHSGSGLDGGGDTSEDLSDRFSLTRKLPVSLRRLKLLESTQGSLGWHYEPEMAAQQNSNPFDVDLQLLELIRDPRFERLRLIKMRREHPKISVDVTGTPWAAYEEAEYFNWRDQVWQVFQRLN